MQNGALSIYFCLVSFSFTNNDPLLLVETIYTLFNFFQVTRRSKIDVSKTDLNFFTNFCLVEFLFANKSSLRIGALKLNATVKN